MSYNSQIDAVNKIMDFVKELYKLILERKKNLPEDSYTTRLFTEGIDRILKKVLEEAGEVVIAAKSDGEAGRQEVIYETCDLIYHLLVLLAEKEVSLQEIEEELINRHNK